MPDIITLIERDHREVEELFAKFSQTGDSSAATQICDELDRHTRAEEEAVYPVIASEVSGGKAMEKEATEEHEEARQLIGRVRRTSDPEHLSELMTQLEQAINHHVEEEEQEILPKLRDAVDRARLDEMGADFEAAKS
jgi:hemerythrin-like domain-containing protein